MRLPRAILLAPVFSLAILTVVAQTAGESHWKS